MSNFQQDIEARFLRYVKVHTTSKEASDSYPSTAIQYDLLNMLAAEMVELGITDAHVSDEGYALGTIPATTDKAIPTVALLAHVDTSPDFSGENVKPIIHRNYDGSVITLPDDERQILDPATFPYLTKKIGDDIVTASGTTLLGADDKAGVAIIMSLAKHLIANPDIVHGPIRLCFTPDEEVGRGVAQLTLEALGADVAYTLDGGKAGEIVYETFSADKALVKITGVSIHPGYATGEMVNAQHLAAKFIEQLPANMTPATTSGRDGFIHVYHTSGGVASAELHMILRDFEREGLADKAKIVEALCGKLRDEEPRALIECTITKQYRNMRYWLEDDMRPVEFANEAAKAAGVEPYSKPTRGGTDGSRLTEMGLPTPNLFTGMQNFHGPLEWVSLQDMALSAETCLELVKLWAEKG